MPSLVDEAILKLDTALVWLEAPQGSRRRHWHRQEDAVLREWWGKIPRPELAERVTRVLRQITGDSQAKRNVNACTNRAYELALPAYNGEPGEMCLKQATRESDVPYHIAYQAVKDGQLRVTKKGKQVYVSELDFSLWLVWYRERQILQAEILNATQGEVTLTKQEAMKLTGLCETHITRYLHTGVIQAWLLPGIKTGRPGEWLVSKASAEALMAARAEGRLGAYLDQHSTYVAMRNQLTKQILDLRHAGRLRDHDPLTEPKSLYHPGCFTVQQVASHLGLSSQAVHEAIANSHVKAQVIVKGGRPRYGITPKEARRYAKQVAGQSDIAASFRGGEAAARRDTWYLRQIAEAGLLTVRDLAGRWGRSEATVILWAKQAKLPRRRWGRYWVFEPEVIASFEATNFLTLRDLAQRWGKSVASAGLWTRKAHLPRRKWGRCWVFELEVIASFEAERRSVGHQGRKLLKQAMGPGL